MSTEFGPSPEDMGIVNKVEQRGEIEKLLPPQENRNGLVVNAVENKKPKGEVSEEELRQFTEAMHARIAEEMARDKTTLPKDRLKLLDEEIEANPQAVKLVLESFGYGVASDLFMLYGIIKKSKDLVKQTVYFYTEVNPSVSAYPKTLEQEPDSDIVDTLREFWNSEQIDYRSRKPLEFPYGEDIQYYSGRDVEIDDENPRYREKQVPGFRHIFGPTRKNKTAYAGAEYISHGAGTYNPRGDTRGPIDQADIERKQEQWRSLQGGTQNYALQFRDLSYAVGQDEAAIVEGYPAEWYIPGSSKNKVLSEYFQNSLVPEIRKSAERKGI